jgi:hypothetical protein
VADLRELARAWTEAIAETDRVAKKQARRKGPHGPELAIQECRAEDAARHAYLAAGGVMPVPDVLKRMPAKGVRRGVATQKVPKNLPCAQIVTSQPDAMAGHPRSGLDLSAWIARRASRRVSGCGA